MPNDVSRETLALLGRYHAELIKWNTRINLVGSSDASRLWERHIVDCLHLAALLPGETPVVDLGSGAGFPGLVIAIARRCPVIMIEADQRKAVFLRECGRALGLSTTVIAKRIESLVDISADVVVARALAPLDRLLDLAAPLLGGSGRCFFAKGARVDAELTMARHRWQMSVQRHPGTRAGGGCVLEVADLHRQR